MEKFNCHGDRKKQEGLTLVELLISIVIMSMIMLALGRLFTNYIRTMNGANRNLDIMAEIRESLDKIGREVRAALPALDPTESGTVHSEFRGTAKNLRWNCVKANNQDELSDIVELSYASKDFEPDNPDFPRVCLQRDIETVNSANTNITLSSDKTTQADPLVDSISTNLARIQGIDISSIEFTYYNSAGAAVEPWNAGGDGTPDPAGAQTTLPALVKITISGTDDDKDDTETLAILVRPMTYGVTKFYQYN